MSYSIRLSGISCDYEKDIQKIDEYLNLNCIPRLTYNITKWKSETDIKSLYVYIISKKDIVGDQLSRIHTFIKSQIRDAEIDDEVEDLNGDDN
jgi:hypothetical protein